MFGYTNHSLLNITKRRLTVSNEFINTFGGVKVGNGKCSINVKFSLPVLAAGVMLLTNGCSSDQVLSSDRPFIPSDAVTTDYTDYTETTTTTTTTTKTFEQEVIGTPSTNNRKQFPAFGDITYEKPVAHTTTYKVVSGDSFWKIANRYGVSDKELAEYNHLDLKKPLRVGQTLQIPAGARERSPEELKALNAKYAKMREANKSKSGGAVVKPVQGKSNSNKNSTSTATTVKPTGPLPSEYVVQAGDNLPKIAKKLGIKASDLQKANNMTDADTRKIQIGAKLKVPGGTVNTGAVVPATTTTATTTDNLTSITPVGNIDTAIVPVGNTDTAIVPVGNTTDLIIPVDDAGTGVDINLTEDIIVPAGGTTVVTVNPGEVTIIEEATTVADLGKKYGFSEADIRSLNTEIGADGKVNAGQLITLPARN